MIAAALTGLVITAIGALCYVAKLENARDDRASNVPGPVRRLPPEVSPPAGPGTTSVRRAGQSPDRRPAASCGGTGPAHLISRFRLRFERLSGAEKMPTGTGASPSDPAATGTVISPCVATSGVAGSEACEPCTVHGCGRSECPEHGDEDAAARAWRSLTAEPGWGELDDGPLDLDAMGFATDEFLIHADQVLGASA